MADAREPARISDLAEHPDLTLGLSHEFMGRARRLAGTCARAYELSAAISPRALDHGLAYEALAAGEVDAIDLYSTDAKIARYGIRVLEDDRRYFPRYDALFLHRIDTPAKHPRAWAAVAALQGRLDEATMIRLNGRAELDGRDFASVAAEFLGAERSCSRAGVWRRCSPRISAGCSGEHVALVLGSLPPRSRSGVPLGIAAARHRGVAQPVLLAAGLVQTIPSLALLAVLIPITGAIGVWPAMIALFLYALLPIVRNTHTRNARRIRGPAAGGQGAGPRGARHPPPRGDAARRTDDPRRREDGGGGQRRHRDHRGLHRRGRFRRAHRAGPRAERPRHAAGRGASRGGAGARIARRLRAAERLVVPAPLRGGS